MEDDDERTNERKSNEAWHERVQKKIFYSSPRGLDFYLHGCNLYQFNARSYTERKEGVEKQTVNVEWLPIEPIVLIQEVGLTRSFADALFFLPSQSIDYFESRLPFYKTRRVIAMHT